MPYICALQVVTASLLHTMWSTLPLSEITCRLVNTTLSKLDLEGEIMAGEVHTSLSLLQLKGIATFVVVHYH